MGRKVGRERRERGEGGKGRVSWAEEEVKGGHGREEWKGREGKDGREERERREGKKTRWKEGKRGEGKGREVGPIWSHDNNKNLVAVHRSSIESNVPHYRFVASRRRAIGVDFAARGRTEISLQSATLDSASAARSRCIIRPRRPAMPTPHPNTLEGQKSITPSRNKFKKTSPLLRADFALRLGPNNERSGVNKRQAMWNTLVPQFKGKPNKTQTKTRPNSDDPQISRPDLRFASRKHSKTTQKGPEPQPKHLHQTQDCLGHGG